MNLQSERRVALVTGSGKGVGAGVVRVLASRGVRCCINCNSNPGMAEKTLQTVEEAGGEAFIRQADVSDPAQMQSMADEVITLVAASGKVFVGLPLTEVKAFQARLLAYMNEKHSELVSEITRARDLSDTLRDRLVKASKAFREEYDKEVKA